jgi:hypothetical protein
MTESRALAILRLKPAATKPGHDSHLKPELLKVMHYELHSIGL